MKRPLNRNPGTGGGRPKWYRLTLPEQLERIELRHRARRARFLKPGQCPEPSLPAGTDLLPQIKHIVVLMMENHSYDNYLGMLDGRGEGFPRNADGQPDVTNLDAEGNPVPCHHMRSTQQTEEVPCQSWHATHAQWNAGKMDGFVTSIQELTPGADPAIGMGYWSEEDLPFYYGLARTFPLADRWFSSCLGPTFPNRRFLIAGTANGLVDDAPFHLLDNPPAGTIFDTLTRHGISWANYHSMAGDKSRGRRLAHYRRRMAHRKLQALGQGLHRMSGGIQKDIQFTADLFPLGIGQHVLHIHGMDQFFADADNGTLPAFSIVDPAFDEFSEENPQDIRKGESFAAEVINRVMHGKGWPDTLLIWTYDEHGGYHDHVPPPEAIPPDDVEGGHMGARPGWLRVLHRLLPGYAKDTENQGDEPMRYDRYGIRVPAVIVSPYARPGCVLSDVFDHTSVLKLVEEKWNLPTLTRRDAAALSPIGALDLSTPPAFRTPPSLPEPALKWGSW
ncbi:MAG: alkaline phosphatase family protein [Actinobacteria bacterium]|nr:alkaline phosphatase family protein [Actinomycetota bacterium]